MMSQAAKKFNDQNGVSTVGSNIGFLTGDGEMVTLIRNKNWDETVLGNVEFWPQSLRTTLGIILHSKFPMFLWWGPELICFYNDAYRPSLGKEGKHPAILGMPAKESWQEIWEIIHPLIQQVLSGNGATWSEDQLIPIYRNGQIENVYWTFSYSAVFDESGTSAGVLVTCMETTDKVMNLQLVKESKDDLQFAIDATELGTWDLNPITKKFIANERLKEWFGLPSEAEIDIDIALNVITEKDREKVIHAINEALQYLSGGHYNIDYTIINPITKKERIVRAKGKALFNEQHIAYRFNGNLQDITEEALTKKVIEESEAKFRSLIEEAPVATSLFVGRDMKIEVANKIMIGYWGKGASVIGKTIAVALPELRDQSFLKILDDVFTTGKTHVAKAALVYLEMNGHLGTYYFDYTYKPLKNIAGEVYGIMVMALDVTEQVMATQKLEESELFSKNIFYNSPVAKMVVAGDDMSIRTINEKMFDIIRVDSSVIGKSISEFLPDEYKAHIMQRLQHVYHTGETYAQPEELFVVNIDGVQHSTYFNQIYKALYNAGGNIYGVMITSSDVTEQVLSRKKIKENEERQNIIIEASGLGIWEWNLLKDELVYSDKYREMFGFKKGNIADRKDFFQRLHPDDISVRYKAVKEAMQNGVLHFEFRIIWDDKSLHWIAARGKVFYDNAKKPVKILGTIRDITEEKEHQQELEEREQKFRLLADFMPQLIWTTNTAGMLNYSNQSFLNYTGLAAEQAKNLGWVQIIHPDEQEENIRQWKESLSTGKDFIFEHRFLQHADAQYRWHLSRAVPLKDATGNIQMWISTSTDINDIKELDQQKDYFISMASHELKTPVTSIKGYIELLQRNFENSTDVFTVNALNKVHKQVEKLTTLISNLLDVSKIKSGYLLLNKENFNINSLVQEVVDEAKHLNPSHEITFEKEADAEVCADKERITQVLTNLLTNAVKYAPGSKKLNVQTWLQDHSVLVSVQDYGIGINKKDHEKIFERFYRAEGKNQITFPGFGIGLFIAAEIIQRHGGKIGVNSQPAKGSEFYFTLPVINQQ